MGFLEVVVGDPGTGKSYFVTRHLALELAALERPHVVIYASPNMDDDAPGWVLTSPALLRRTRRFELGDGGTAFLALRHASGLEAVRIARAWSRVVRVLLVLDESHRVMPNYGQPWQEDYTAEERQELRAWVTELLRMGRHQPLSVLALSPTIAGLHPEIWRFARVTYYFHQGETSDQQTIERRYGARAALEVARLQPRQFIRAQRSSPPPGWTGYLATLERKVRT